MFKEKKNAKGDMERYKTRLIQKHRFNHEEVFAPIIEYHERRKYIYTRFHSFRKYVGKNEIELHYIKTEDQIAAILLSL